MLEALGQNKIPWILGTPHLPGVVYVRSLRSGVLPSEPKAREVPPGVDFGPWGRSGPHLESTWGQARRLGQVRSGVIVLRTRPDLAAGVTWPST